MIAVLGPFRVKHLSELGVVAHTFNPSTQEAEAEAGGFLSLRSTWSTKRVPGHPGLHRETLYGKNKTKHLSGDTWERKPFQAVLSGST